MGKNGVLILSFFGWSLLFLWQALNPFAQGSDIQTIQSQYSQRQQQNLEMIVQKESEPVEQAAALFFLDREPEKMNSLVIDFDAHETDSIECTLALRLINASKVKPGVFDEKSINHLEKGIANWIRNSSLLLATGNRPPHFPERDEILDISNLALWAQYVDQATPEYRWPDKKSNEEHKKIHSQNAHEWLEHRLRYGFRERSSPFSFQSMAGLLNLCDWSEDPRLRIKAEAVIDVLIADMAQESIQNQWGGIHCRDLESLYPLPSNRLQNILFGWPTEGEIFQLNDSLILHLCHSPYRPPTVLVRLARETRIRGIYQIQNRFSSVSDQAEPVINLYGYITPNFILSSFQLRDESVPWQSRPWDLLVLDDQGIGHHLFTFSGTELASGGVNSLDEEYYLWNATCFQHKNVLFCRFGRSDRKRVHTDSDTIFIDSRFVQFPTRVWIPNALSPVLQEDEWWFCQIEAVYLAFRPLNGRSYWWRTSEAGADPEEGASILTFQDLYTGFLLEIESASHFTSFEQFKEQIRNSHVAIDHESVTFVSRRGDVFLFPLDDGDFLVNGRVDNPKVDSNYKLFNSPFIQSEYGSGILKANWQEHSLMIDISDPENPKRIVNPD